MFVGTKNSQSWAYDRMEVSLAKMISNRRASKTSVNTELSIFSMNVYKSLVD